VAVFAGAPAVHGDRFRSDVDALLDQNPARYRPLERS
jgi:hypothetical protein